MIFKEDALSWALDNNLLKESQAQSSTIQFETALSPGDLAAAGISLGVENTLVLKADSSVDIPVPSPIPYEEGMILEYEISVKELDPELSRPQAPPLPSLPAAPDANFKGVTVKSFGSSAKPRYGRNRLCRRKSKATVSDILPAAETAMIFPPFGPAATLKQ